MNLKIVAIFVVSFAALVVATDHSGDSDDDAKGHCHKVIHELPQTLELAHLEFEEFAKIIKDASADDIRYVTKRIAYQFKRLIFDFNNLLASGDMVGPDDKINLAYRTIELDVFKVYLKIRDEFRELPDFQDVKNRNVHFIDTCLADLLATDWLSLKHDFGGFLNPLVKGSIKCMKTGSEVLVNKLDLSHLPDGSVKDPQLMYHKVQQLLEISDEMRHVLNFIADVEKDFKDLEKGQITFEDIVLRVYCLVKEDIEGKVDAANCGVPASQFPVTGHVTDKIQPTMNPTTGFVNKRTNELRRRLSELLRRVETKGLLREK